MNAALYNRFRAAGYRPAEALRAVRAVTEFEPLADAELVRLRLEQEQESYFSVYGEPEGYTDANGRKVSAEQEREELCATIERDGCWCLVADYRASTIEPWRVCESVGMLTGYGNPCDPFQCCYVPDFMRAAVDAVRAQIEAANL